MSPMWMNLPALLGAAAAPEPAAPGGFNLIRSAILTLLGGTLLILAVARCGATSSRSAYALLFGLSGLPFLVLAFWPGAILLLGQLLHMEYFTVMLLCVSTFLILMVFELLTIVSQQDQRIATLAQTMGIVQERQKELEHSARPATAMLDAGEKAAPPAVVEAASEELAAPAAAPRPEVTIKPVVPRRVRDVVRSE